MFDLKKNERVIQKKNDFFNKYSQNKDTEYDFTTIDKEAEDYSYASLLEDQKMLEYQFTFTFEELHKQKQKQEQEQKQEYSDAFWLYCYYCAALLETFHNSYSQKSKADDYTDSQERKVDEYTDLQKSKADEYTELKKKIKNRLKNTDINEKIPEKAFIESLKKTYSDGFSNLKSAPYHISRIRDYVAYANLCRVYWIFCRLTVTTGLALAKDMQIIDKLDALLGTHTDIDKIVSVIQSPNGILNYFSVGLFLMRFMIDGGLLIKHTFFPEATECKNLTTKRERFIYEAKKRGFNFANDSVWATVNFLTNFNHITRIPGPVANAMTVVFLGFDVGMTLLKCYLAKQEYLIKKEQYDKELEVHRAKLELIKTTAQGLCPEGKTPEIVQENQHIAMLEAQLKALELDWRTKQGTFYFVASAAALLMAGFSVALLFTPPGMVLASFFVCTLATAMYLSAGVYSKYQEKSLRLENLDLTPKERYVALKEYEAARNDFMFTMVKNAVIPTLLITTFAICWPAAIVLTAMYTGYEIYHAYDQHNSKKEAAQIAFSAPS